MRDEPAGLKFSELQSSEQVHVSPNSSSFKILILFVHQQFYKIQGLSEGICRLGVYTQGGGSWDDRSPASDPDFPSFKLQQTKTLEEIWPNTETLISS